MLFIKLGRWAPKSTRPEVRQAVEGYRETLFGLPKEDLLERDQPYAEAGECLSNLLRHATKPNNHDLVKQDLQQYIEHIDQAQKKQIMSFAETNYDVHAQ